MELVKINDIDINGMTKEIVLYDHWLDASTYYKIEKINSWLDYMGIGYEHVQRSKCFLWRVTDERAAALFALRWA